MIYSCTEKIFSMDFRFLSVDDNSKNSMNTKDTNNESTMVKINQKISL